MPIALVLPEEFYEQPGPWVDILKEGGFEVRYPKNPKLTQGTFGDSAVIEELQGVSATIAGGEIYNADVLRSLPDLRVVARCGVGYDRVDVDAASKNGVVLTITPSANHECVAEHAFALMFAVARQISLSDRNLRAGLWKRTILRPLRSSTLGLVGLGRIGRSVAVRGIALGMKVIAHDDFADQDFAKEHDVEMVTLDELLERSDFLSLHCPANDQTQGMINRDTIAKMKDDAILINTARGAIVAEADLIEALESGKLGGAGLDVFETEPASPDNPLFRMDHVVSAPHIGGADTLSLRNMGIEAAENIVKLSRGEWPEAAAINGDLAPGWTW